LFYWIYFSLFILNDFIQQSEWFESPEKTRWTHSALAAQSPVLFLWIKRTR
jgi:hypothetical protein